MKKLRKAPLPNGVRQLIYSFLDFKELIFLVGKLSNNERNMIIDSDVLN